jgi:hypothetical protein
MRPLVSATSPVSTLNVVYTIATADVGIAIEVVVHVDVDIAATPAGTPTPTAAPGSTHGPANTK